MLTCSYSIFMPVLYLTKYTCSWPDNWRTVNFFAMRKPLQYALGHKPFGWIWAESITLYTSQILLLLSAVTSSVNIIAFIPLAAIQPMYSLCQFFQVLHVGHDSKSTSSSHQVLNLHPTIQQLLAPPLAAILTVCCMYFSVSHVIIEEFWRPLLYNVASIHCGLWAFVMHSSLKDSAFQSGWILKCDLAQQIDPFLYQLFCCSAGDHYPVV